MHFLTCDQSELINPIFTINTITSKSLNCIILCNVGRYAHNINDKYGYFCHKPLIYAQNTFKWGVWHGNLDIVKQLLYNSYLNSENWCNDAIRIAVYFGYFNIVNLLLQDSRADPSNLNNYAIRKAVYFGYHEIVKLLLRDPRVSSLVRSTKSPKLAYDYLTAQSK